MFLWIALCFPWYQFTDTISVFFVHVFAVDVIVSLSFLEATLAQNGGSFQINFMFVFFQSFHHQYYTPVNTVSYPDVLYLAFKLKEYEFFISSNGCGLICCITLLPALPFVPIASLLLDGRVFCAAVQISFAKTLINAPFSKHRNFHNTAAASSVFKHVADWNMDMV